jgi:hypothetical protein
MIFLIRVNDFLCLYIVEKNPVQINKTQASLEKLMMDATSSRKLKYIFFFSFCSIFEPRGLHRTSNTRRSCHIGQTFPTPQTHFERSTFIEISSARRKRIYRKKITDHSDTFGLLGIYQNSNQLRKRIMSTCCF